VGPGSPTEKGTFGVTLRHVQIRLRSIFSTLFARGSSDATSGYSTVADSRVIAHLLYIIHVPWSAYVSVLGTLVSPAKTVVPIKMPFGEQTSVDPRNRVLHGVYVGAN